MCCDLFDKSSYFKIICIKMKIYACYSGKKEEIAEYLKCRIDTK